MKKIYLLIILAVAVVTHAESAPLSNISRQRALDEALKSNPAYLASIEDRQSAKYSYIGSFSEFLPSADLGWRTSNSEQSISSGLQISESYTATAGINLFRGFRSFASVNRSRLNYHSYSETEKETLLTTIRDVNLAYQAALRDDYLRKSYYTLFESAELLLSEAVARQELDIISRADLYNAKADRERAYSAYLDAEVAYKEALLEITRLTGLAVDNNTTLAVDERKFNLQPMNLYTESALENNNALQRSYINRDMAGYSYGSAYGAFLPSVDASASTGWYIGDQTEDYNSQSVSLSASWNIFSGFYDVANTLANAKARNSARLNVLYVRDNLMRQVKGAWLRAQAADEKVLSAEAYVEAAQESYTAMQEMFRLGRALLKDTVDARATLEEAQASLANAKYLMVQSYEELSLLTGGEL